MTAAEVIMPESSEIEPSLSISRHLNVAMSIHLDHLVQPKKKSNLWQGVCWHIKKYILQNHLYFHISLHISSLKLQKCPPKSLSQLNGDVSAFFKKKQVARRDLDHFHLAKEIQSNIPLTAFPRLDEWWNPVCWRHILHGKSSKNGCFGSWKLELLMILGSFSMVLYWSGPCWEIPQKNHSLHLPWIFGTGIIPSIYSNK